MPDKKFSVSEELEQAKAKFTSTQNGASDSFRDARKTYDSIVFREVETELPPELTGAQEGIDYQSPKALKTLFDHKNVIKMNSPVFDAVSLDDSIAGKEKVRDILLTLSRGWEYENDARWWDDAVAEGQVLHGVKVMGYRWHDLPEPEIDTSDMDDMDEDEKASETIKRRNEAFKGRKWPFYWIDPDTYGCYWLGDERQEFGPDVFFYEYDLPMIQAQNRFTRANEDGRQKITFDAAGKLGWIGQDVEPDIDHSDTKVKVLVRDGRKLSGEMCPLKGCDHPLRTIDIYASLGDGDLDEDNLIESYDSPFPGCSYFVIGGYVTNHRDPHYRYQGMMTPLLVEILWVNYLNTLLATIARTDYADEYFYISLSRVPEGLKLPEGGQTMMVDKPDPGSGQIPIYPGEVMRFPKTASPHLMELINQSQQRMSDLEMNRFLSGNAYTEASNATMGAFKSQYQQAALPYNQMHNEADRVRKASRRFALHAIRFWAQADPEGAKTRYYVVMTGGMKTTPKDTVPGKVVWIDADKIGSVNFDLSIHTESETLAEKEQRWFIAKDQHIYGVLDDEQLLREAGVDDTVGQMERLRAQYTRQDMEPEIQAMRKQLLLARLSARLGMDVAQLLAPMQGDPNAGGGAPSNVGNPAVQANNGVKNQGPPSGAPVGMPSAPV